MVLLWAWWLRNKLEKSVWIFSLKQGQRLSNLNDFTHKIDHFVQGLDMLSTGRLSQTLIHPRQFLTLLRKVVCDVTMKNSQFVLYTQNFIIIMKCTQFHSLTLQITLLSKYWSSLLTTNKLQWICINTYSSCSSGQRYLWWKESKYTRLHLKQNHLAIQRRNT